MPDYDVVVVGLGGMGSAVAAHAAARGLRVLGLEQFDEGHDRGASSGASRIIRKAYFEDPAYVPLLVRAYELWRDLEAQTGADIMQLTGMLMVGDATSSVLAGARASAALHALALEELTPRAAMERYPMVRVRPHEQVLFERDAGFVRPEAAIAAHVALARTHGAELRFATRVEGWDDVGAGMRVRLSDGSSLRARSLVLTVGPWFAEHPGALGTLLRIQRNVQAWFATDDARFALGTLPVFYVDRPDAPAALYGFPDHGLGVKAAFHGFGEITRPDALRREVSADEVEPLSTALEAWLPGASGVLRAAKACMYSLTPDEHFAIAPQSNARNVVVAGGFSGHGFKFSSVVGEIVTDLVVTGTSRHEIGFLSPQRFAGAG